MAHACCMYVWVYVYDVLRSLCIHVPTYVYLHMGYVYVCIHARLCVRMYLIQGRGVHVTGVSAAYTFKLNKNILSE
jgi:hypothetical protein